MKNILLKIAYDGSSYGGWQKQNNSISIQDTIQKAICEITKEDVILIASGRTDSGVHALEQVCNFMTNSYIKPEKFAYAINSKLPYDIRVLSSSLVDIDFNARFSAKKKTYMYQIYNHKILHPIYYKYSMQVIGNLDIQKMSYNANMLLGTHDFSSFYTKQKNDNKNPIRTIYESKLYKKDELIIFEIQGSGFLYNMVRILVGTLIDIGLGKSNMDINQIMQKKDRKYAGATAKSKGLFLKKVYYE